MISGIIFKKFFFVLFCLTVFAISFSTKAQSNFEDVVYLKNGSIIHGMIIEQIPNESIKIKSGENIFVYKMDEILKITKEEINPAAIPIPAPVPVPDKTLHEKKTHEPTQSKSHGYVNTLEITWGHDILHNHS